jgi:hypothetical protein
VAWVEARATPPPESPPALLLELVRRVLAQAASGAWEEAPWQALLAHARQRCAPFELADMLLEAGRCAARAGAREPLQRLLDELQALVTLTPALRTRWEALLAEAGTCLAESPEDFKEGAPHEPEQSSS